MNKKPEKLPRSPQELEDLASYYDEHDTGDEMEDGRWVEPMVTTSLRLPRDVFDQVKEKARREGKRHTAYIRDVVTHAVSDTDSDDELREISSKLDELLQAVQPETTSSSAKTAAVEKKRPTTTKRVATPRKRSTSKDTKRSA